MPSGAGATSCGCDPTGTRNSRIIELIKRSASTGPTIDILLNVDIRAWVIVGKDHVFSVDCTSNSWIVISGKKTQQDKANNNPDRYLEIILHEYNNLCLDNSDVT